MSDQAPEGARPGPGVAEGAERRPASISVTRRRLLSGGAATAAVATLAAACSKGKGTGGGGGPASPPTTAANSDLDAAALAAGIEKLASDTYTATGTMATQGKLGALIPAAVSDLVETARRQHQEHMDAWNKILTAAGRQPVTEPNAQLKPLVDTAAANLTDVPGAATLALRLEDYASQTYLKMLPTLKSPEAVKLAGQILVVDQQHQAVLRYVLGLVPVGSGVGKDTRDFAPSDPRPSLIAG